LKINKSEVGQLPGTTYESMPDPDMKVMSEPVRKKSFRIHNTADDDVMTIIIWQDYGCDSSGRIGYNGYPFRIPVPVWLKLS
jgi:hypothetical protein